MWQTDIKIFDLIEILKSVGLIRFKREFCDNIGFLEQNIARVRQGKAHFTAQHIQSICTFYDVNANFIVGTSDVIFNKKR